jgi:tetrahydromethanopterin S-methyltransferase subunit G
MNDVWIDIGQKFEAMENMGCKPYGFKRVSSNFVFDEDKSVKWNKEQAQKNNDDYDNEVKRLNQEKMKRMDEIYAEIYKTIQEEVGFGISEKKAEKIWGYAYDRGHSAGWYEIIINLEEIEELVKFVLVEKN